MNVRQFLAVLLGVSGWMAAAPAAGSGLGIADRRLQVLAGTEVVAQSPADGLWSVACGWKDGWPADWHHAGPTQTPIEGEWTIVRGRLEACGGVFELEDAYRLEGDVVRGLRRFTWKGTQPLKQATLSVRFDAIADAAQPVLPGILYYGCPSGARSGRVPVSMGKPGEESICEEHRFPMPFASLELRRGASLRGVALHTVPSPAPYGNRPDEWWSLGFISNTALSVTVRAPKENALKFGDTEEGAPGIRFRGEFRDKDKTRDGSYTVPAGSTATFRSRVAVHPGPLSRADAANLASDFAKEK